MDKDDVLKVISNKRYQLVATILILIIILLMSSSIRLSNWDLLTDSTTGEKIPLALDPFYFLRVAETIVENEGSLPEFDEMRSPGFNVAWHQEIMPQVVVKMWKVANIFGEYTLEEVNIFSPVLFYGIALIIFFILAYILTNSKLIAILSSAFLAFTPAFLYRTMAGFSDHEGIGIMAFFATLLSLALSIKYLDKEKLTYGKTSIYALLTGFVTAFTIASWAGVAVFIFMIIPISFFLLWVTKTRHGNSFVKPGILFYGLWVASSIIFSWILGSGPQYFLNRFLLSSTGIIVPAIFGIIIVDSLLIAFGDKISSRYYNHNKRILYSIGILIIASMVVLPLIGRNFFSLLWEILNRLLNPLWGSSRLDTTVAENAQPFLQDWINIAGKPLFFLFVGGLLFIGINFAKHIRSAKSKTLVMAGFIVMTLGILFSRISPTSILNGGSIFSLGGAVYLGGIAFFCWAFFGEYIRRGIKISPGLIIVSSWMLISIITGRSTTRMFFTIAPFMCFSAAYFVISAIKKSREKGGDEIMKVIFIGLAIIGLIVSAVIINTSYEGITNQAKYTSPSANTQWQRAMSWVRNNTDENAVFSHWWDYGYWVQTLGERATIADGGHAQSIYDGNHRIGRYILTTPRPETALSMFKTLDVDYLLIDQTDLGKYPAYSKIGGGDGEDALDRYAAIPVMPNDIKQTKETANGTMIVFSGGSHIYEDIIYEDRFLPSGKAAVVGIIVNLEGNLLKQPEAVYIYNNIQTRIPIRYVYVNGEFIDFGSGLDAVIDIIPSFDGRQINQMGAAIYLSQKVSKSLFAQLFLMDDPFDNYGDVKLVYTEDSPIVESLRGQGLPLDSFIYYQGFRGPIKIWDVQEISEEIKIVEEFKEPFNGTFGALDGMRFIE